VEVDLTKYPLHIVYEAALADSGREEIEVALLRQDRAVIRISGSESSSRRRRLRDRLEALAAADAYATTTAPLRQVMMQSALSLSHGAEETIEALKGLLGLPSKDGDEAADQGGNAEAEAEAAAAADQGDDYRPAFPVCPDILDELP